MRMLKLDLKSVLSITVAFVFAYMACTGQLRQDFVQNIILMVFTFFFVHQIGKKIGGE